MLTNKSFYHLTHSPAFINLKILDLRNNLLSSLSVLNINMLEIKLPKLKELYLSINSKKKENIEYFFSGTPGRFLELGKLFQS